MSARDPRPGRTARRAPVAVADTRKATARVAADLGEARGTVGMVVLDFTNPFFAEVARGAELAAQEAGFALVLMESRGDPARERRCLDVLVDRAVDGILLTPASSEPTQLAKLLDLPAELVLTDCKGPDGASWFAADNELGGELAGQHLLSLGHEHIAFVNGPATIQVCAERRSGLHRAVTEAGLDPAVVIEEINVPATSSFEGQGIAGAVVDTEASAVFCVNDLLAIGLLRSLSDDEVAVPDELAVMGYDDIEFAHVLQPPLSTVRQPKRELGRAAAEQLLAQLESPGDPVHEIFEPQLVVRRSTTG